MKLYYAERESGTVAAAVAGEQIAFTALHELEIVTAMQLKIFRGEAKPEQVVATIGLLHEDVVAGKLVESPTDLREICDRIWQPEEEQLLSGRATPSDEEKALLDSELEDYSRNPEAGPGWQEIKSRLKQ